MERVIILGGPGAGKSTLARELGKIHKLPVHHIDSYFWMDNWTPRESGATRQWVGRIARGDRWILDGNYFGSIDVRMARADTLIFLDLMTLHRCIRVLFRTWRGRGQTRPDMGPNCPERLDWEFVSFTIGYSFNGARARTVELLRNAPQNLRTVWLKTPRSVARFLQAETP